MISLLVYVYICQRNPASQVFSFASLIQRVDVRIICSKMHSHDLLSCDIRAIISGIRIRRRCYPAHSLSTKVPFILQRIRSVRLFTIWIDHIRDGHFDRFGEPCVPFARIRMGRIVPKKVEQHQNTQSPAGFPRCVFSAATGLETCGESA